MSQTRRLLIVDDDADLRNALVEQLALHPEFQVQAVETAEAAVQAVASATPDFIIIDNPIDHPPADAEIAMSIDGRQRRWSVHLPDGVVAAQLRTKITSCA